MVPLYHAITYGWLAEELLRQVDPQETYVMSIHSFSVYHRVKNIVFRVFNFNGYYQSS